jgi:hypothetical protein
MLATGMSARELAIVLLRVIGIYLLIHLVTAGPAALWALGYLLTSFDQSRSVVSGMDWLGWSQIAFTIWPVVVYAAASITLLVRAPGLAARLVPGDSRPGRMVVGRRLQATLITGVGVAVLAGIAPRVATTVVTLAMFSRVEPIAGTVTDTLRWPALLELGVTLGIGLYLCLGARGLSNAIQTLRGHARPRSADGDAHSSD